MPSDDEFLKRYAHQLSGGQVQRVALAMAFLPKPKVLVLDEPTTGLDVTTQKMVLDTMAELCRSHGVSALYVTHDLAVVANIADRVAEYIPEYAAHGKDAITIEHVLSHRAGVPNLPSEALDLDNIDDHEHLVKLLCDAKPSSRPGRAPGYHAVSGGFIAAESGRMPNPSC